MKKARVRHPHPEPSKASLREMPEVDFAKVKLRRNPYAARIAAEGYTVQVGKGRPRKGREMGPTVPKSIRLPVLVWAQVEKCAKARGLTLHAALRRAIVGWMGNVSR